MVSWHTESFLILITWRLLLLLPLLLFIENRYKEESVAVKRILLTATVRLFFIRPPEVQAMLGRLMPQALNDVAR